jgi:phage head maturation protease
LQEENSKEEIKMGEKFDFSGWATKNDLRCTDGRTIRGNAFKSMDGKQVPLVWQHCHNDPSNVLGYAVLKHMDEGVYAYGKFNDTESGKISKQLVKHGDIDRLSIFANHLVERGKDVLHGEIKEVSLVLAGANPGAYIENVMIHSDDGPYIDEGQATITMDDSEITTEFAHSDDIDEMDEERLEEIYDSLSDEQRALFDAVLDSVDDEDDDEDKDDDDEFEHADDDGEGEGEFDLEGVISSMNDEEKQATQFLLGMAKKAGGDPEKLDTTGVEKELEAAKSIFDRMTDEKKLGVMMALGMVKEGAMAHDDINNEEETDMKTNVFDSESKVTKGTTLSHSDTVALMEYAKENRVSSFKQLFKDKLNERRAELRHDDDDYPPTVTATYGIENIDYLFPDAKVIQEQPEFIKRDTGWVNVVMNKTTHKPFSRIKTIWADITEDQARAKGYIKGNQKTTEVFPLLRRVTTPFRIYKLQKLDKDDIDDITWDIVPYLKNEMRGMVDEEIARAAIYGDGREAVDLDKINETNIRPVVSDKDLYTIKVPVTGSDADIAYQLPDTVVTAMDEYKGSGNVVAFVKQSIYTKMLLTKDGMGYRLYKSPAELATAMTVSQIVPVPNDIAGNNYLVALDLKDYAFGSEKGGQMSTFDDFDIDFNQFKYLMEVRLSGALTKPFSAISIYKTTGEG